DTGPTVDVVLWGERATTFPAEQIHRDSGSSPHIIIFVGTLVRSYAVPEHKKLKDIKYIHPFENKKEWLVIIMPEDIWLMQLEQISKKKYSEYVPPILKTQDEDTGDDDVKIEISKFSEKREYSFMFTRPEQDIAS
ncbi:hypothetical protein ACJX0J_018705, partial [Zea mays]